MITIPNRLLLAATSSATLTLALGLGGCKQQSTTPPYGVSNPSDVMHFDPQIQVLPSDLQGILVFSQAVVIDDEGPLRVQVPTKNQYENLYLVDYRFLFFDENGLQLEPAMNWTMQAFQPRQTLNLSANAMGNNARSWKLELKWSK